MDGQPWRVWTKVLEERRPWLEEQLMVLMRRATEPVSWRMIDEHFLALGLTEKEIPAVEIIISELQSAHRIERLLETNRYRYQIPVLDRLAEI